jgi:hypothetical protein
MAGKKGSAKKSSAKKKSSKKKPPKNGAHLKMAAVVVAIDSNFEPVTEAPFNFREKNVYPHFDKRGFTIVRCQGHLASRNDVAPQVLKSNVVYLTGVGHGFQDQYTGEGFHPIFSVGHYNAAEAKGKIVHFFSCETAGRLGPDFVANGCRAYFGYSDIFTYPPGSPETFFDCDSEIDRAFADGLTAGQVFDRVKALFAKRIADLKATGNNGDLFKASILETNLSFLRAPSLGAQYGDPEAKLV